MADMTIKNDKATLRQHLKTLRADIPAEQREESSHRIAERLFKLPDWQTARSTFIFVSFNTEVHTHDIIRQLLQSLPAVSVPRIIDKDHMLALRITDWEQLQVDKMGILAPIEGEVWNEGVDIAVTPGLGFTEQGQRLGLGAGYYDKWFSSHPCKLKVALAFETQIQDDIPTDQYDIPVDLIVTEKRLIDARKVNNSD